MARLITFFCLTALFVFVMTPVVGAQQIKAKAAKVAAGIQQASAVPSRFLTLRTFAEWKSLSHANQQLYLIGLQEMMNDLDDIDQQNHVEYQTAGFEWLRALFPEANAAEKATAKTCVYAGWVSHLDAGGRYCQRPPQGSCSPSQVQCQPLLYGKLCVPSGRSATQLCGTRAKPIADIAREVAKHESDWEQFRQKLTAACVAPKQTQIHVCARLRSRLAQMESVVGTTGESSSLVVKPATPASKASASAPLTISPPETDVDKDVTASVAAGPQATTPDKVQVDDASAAGGPSTQKAHLQADCSAYKLASPFDFQPGTETAESDVLIVGLRDAQTLMCTDSQISKSQIDAWRSSVLSLLQRAKRLPGKQARFYADAANSYLRNFDACVAQARSARDRGVILVDSGQAATFRFHENQVDVDVPGHKLEQTGELLIAVEMHIKGLSLCQSTIIGEPVDVPKSARPAGAGGSAQ